MTTPLCFKVDENLPAEVTEHLQRAGYDAKTVLDEHLTGSSDMVLAATCQREKRALLTLDSGFADIRAYQPNQYAGMIVLRLKQQDKPHVLKTVSRLIAVFNREPLEGHLWIVEEGRVRIRG